MGKMYEFVRIALKAEASYRLEAIRLYIIMSFLMEKSQLTITVILRTM